MTEQSTGITLRVNGESILIGSPLVVLDLLTARGLADKRVAVERNGAIVPRSRHGETVLDDGDRIEIIIAVGGG
jgi:sulfur carrier protein